MCTKLAKSTQNQKQTNSRNTARVHVKIAGSVFQWNKQSYSSITISVIHVSTALDRQPLPLIPNYTLMHDDLHWLHIPQRVQYKLAVTVHRCLQHQAPGYLADYCVPVSEVPGRQHLWSARCHQLLVPRVRRGTIGTRAYSVAGPTVWNSLHDWLRDPAVDSKQFRQDLKTYLFAGHSRR